MIKVKKKNEEMVVFFNGVTVKISTEKVFDGEGEFVVVEIANTSGKKLMVKTPKEEWRLPGGIYC